MMQNRFLWIIVAILSIVGGVVALSNPVLASGFATMLVGWSFILMGIVQAIAGLRAAGMGAKIWSLLLGALAVYFGITILSHPLQGMIALTSAVAILCIAGGIFKIVLSFGLEDRRYFWLILLSGLASLALGIVIFANWPVSAVSALGILLGIQLLADGVSSLAMALSRDANEEGATV